jgi:hypothetical protein
MDRAGTVAGDAGFVGVDCRPLPPRARAAVKTATTTAANRKSVFIGNIAFSYAFRFREVLSSISKTLPPSFLLDKKKFGRRMRLCVFGLIANNASMKTIPRHVFARRWLKSMLLVYLAFLTFPREGFTQTNAVRKTLPIHRAAESGNLDALIPLVEDTNNLNAKNEQGLTPLVLAFEKGYLSAVALLVDSGADVNARDPDGNTVLQRYVIHAFPFIATYPPSNWIARVGRDPRKSRYLEPMAHNAHPDWPQPPDGVVMEAGFLLACGTDPSATNRAGQTAMQLAMDPNSMLFDNRTPILKLLRSADPDAAKAAEAKPAAARRLSPELTIRTNTETGLMMFRDHWGEADVRLLDVKHSFNILGTTLAMDANGTNFEVRLLTAIFEEGTNEFPDGYFLNFGAQVRTATNELDWSNIIGQKDYDVLFDPILPKLPFLTVTQEGRERIDERHTLFLYEMAGQVPLRANPGTNRTYINLSYSIRNELSFFKFIFQAVPGKAPLVACEPPAHPGVPLRFTPVPWATNAIPADSHHSVGLTVQKRPDWFIVSCAPAAGSADAEQACSGRFLSGAEGVRVFLVKPDQGGNK